MALAAQLALAVAGSHNRLSARRNGGLRCGSGLEALQGARDVSPLGLCLIEIGSGLADAGNARQSALQIEGIAQDCALLMGQPAFQTGDGPPKLGLSCFKPPDLGKPIGILALGAWDFLRRRLKAGLKL